MHVLDDIHKAHELVTLIVSDAEERLLRLRDEQRVRATVEYSPTSPGGSDNDDANILILAVGRQQPRAGSPLRPDEVEWILDSGSQINVAGDLSLLVNVTELPYGETIECANGSTEWTSTAGSVLMDVINDADGKVQNRLLHDVRYAPSARVSLISMDYMQMTCGFRLCVSKTSVWHGLSSMASHSSSR
jgi:hypothetical protein